MGSFRYFVLYDLLTSWRANLYPRRGVHLKLSHFIADFVPAPSVFVPVAGWPRARKSGEESLFPLRHPVSHMKSIIPHKSPFSNLPVISFTFLISTVIDCIDYYPLELSFMRFAKTSASQHGIWEIAHGF